ncbi:MAG: hypothetical protein PUA84_05025 [Oscillospiraceae bacterium]|nr:hypothetical protein [Oscillospiraceae bacterium]
MNKISCGQLTSALLLSNAFMLMCLSAPVGKNFLAGTLISFVLQALLCIPITILYKKGFSLSAYCEEKHYLIPCSFALYFIIRGGISFLLVWNGAEQLSLPFSEPLVTAVLIGIVCLYTASLGLQAFARASSVVFGILVITLVILLLGAFKRADIANLPLSDEGTVFGNTAANLAMADTLPAFFVLMSFTKDNASPKTLMFLPAGLILWELVIFLCITVLGSLLPSAPYPFFLLTSVSQPLTTQRADAVYLILFVLLCIVRITLLTVLSAHIMGMVFPKLRFRSIISLLLMIAAAAFFSIINYTGGIFGIITILHFAFAVPFIFCFMIKKHSSWKEKTET